MLLVKKLNNYNSASLIVPNNKIKYLWGSLTTQLRLGGNKKLLKQIKNRSDSPYSCEFEFRIVKEWRNHTLSLLRKLEFFAPLLFSAHAFPLKPSINFMLLKRFKNALARNDRSFPFATALKSRLKINPNNLIISKLLTPLELRFSSSFL